MGDAQEHPVVTAARENVHLVDAALKDMADVIEAQAARIVELDYIAQLVAFPGDYEGRPTDDEIRKLARATQENPNG